MAEYLKYTGNRFRNLKKDKIAFKNLLLQMDNTRPHSAKRTQTYLEQNGVPIVPQSAYSPDLNYCDRFLFTRLLEHCRAKEYGNGKELYIDANKGGSRAMLLGGGGARTVGGCELDGAKRRRASATKAARSASRWSCGRGLGAQK